MDLVFSSFSSQQAYALMTQTVIPRPIAWVLTANESHGGGYNLAPFSYFNALCSDPPTVMISVGQRPSGELKDTAGNLQNGAACVIHIPSREQIQACNLTASPLEPGESEVMHAGLETVPFGDFSLPRIRGSAIAMAGHAAETIRLGRKSQQSIILIELERLFVADHCVTEDDKGRLQVDAWQVDPVARLGPTEYCTLGERLNLPRPF